MRGGGGDGRRRPRVVLFPCPFQGHVNPMFQLAALFRSSGFSVTLFHATGSTISPELSGDRYPHYDFVSIPDGLPDQAPGGDILARVAALNANCEAPFRDRIAKMLSPESGSVGPSIACVIVDAVFHRVQAAAKQLGLPTLVLRTGSAACFNVFIAHPLLWSKGYLPIQESNLEVPVTELPPLRVKDLLRFDQSSPQLLSLLLEQMVKEARTSSGIIFNTFDAIEGTELDKLRREFGAPLFAIGPLCKMSPGAQSNLLLTPDLSCMEWLDKQAPSSVLYVSLGSLASMAEEELIETAWGLANSRQPFLWVVRPGCQRGGSSEQVELPTEFVEEVQGRGVTVRWAPQQEVLGHPAVGGFWTHSGWNSTVESLCEGVPMLCRPCFSDQMGNARYVSHVWKVGIALDQDRLRREDIEKAIRRLMVEEEGREMRAGAKAIKEEAARCIELGGSSRESLDNLLDLIGSLQWS